jgi:S-adenosylmethionine/arginine decarboxylase-like enzyme
MTDTTPWGWLCCVDARHCNENINDPEIIQDFVDEVLDNIEMVPIGNTHILWCDTHDPMKAGISVYQLLQDSNLSIHFCPKNDNQAYLDCFSCKSFDAKTVEDLFVKYFSPEKTAISFIERLAPL